MVKRDWTLMEDLACLYLYLKNGRKQVDDNSQEAMELASAIGRTPGAVAYKSANFRYIDSGKDGFSNGSKVDFIAWKAYSEDIEYCEKAYYELVNSSDTFTDVITAETHISKGDYYVPDTFGRAAMRASQATIKGNALSIYENRCAMCDIDHPALLIARHIIPWSKDQNVRADPRNVLLLCALHDKLFDKGLISISKEFTIIASADVSKYSETHKIVKEVENKKLRLPKEGKYWPKWSMLSTT